MHGDRCHLGVIWRFSRGQLEVNGCSMGGNGCVEEACQSANAHRQLMWCTGVKYLVYGCYFRNSYGSFFSVQYHNIYPSLHIMSSKRSGDEAADSRSSNATRAKKPAGSAADEESAPASIEQYTQLKNQLTQEILKKQELDAKLNQIEALIYEKENEYFNESTYGNIIKGFENFSKSSSSSGGGSNKRKNLYTDDDHIFSLSSANFVKTLMKRQGLSMNGSVSKDDFDDYEDSVDPNETVRNLESPSSSNSTPGRKRKARVIED